MGQPPTRPEALQLLHNHGTANLLTSFVFLFFIWTINNSLIMPFIRDVMYLKLYIYNLDSCFIYITNVQVTLLACYTSALL